MLPSKQDQFEEIAIASLLRHRFGDDMVHVQSRDDRILLKRAVVLGLVDRTGYLTTSGREFCDAGHPGVEPHPA